MDMNWYIDHCECWFKHQNHDFLHDFLAICSLRPSEVLISQSQRDYHPHQPFTQSCIAMKYVLKFWKLSGIWWPGNCTFLASSSSFHEIRVANIRTRSVFGVKGPLPEWKAIFSVSYVVTPVQHEHHIHSRRFIPK